MTVQDKELANRAKKVVGLSTYTLIRIVSDGINRSFEHYHYIASQRELNKRLRKRKVLEIND